MNFFKWIGKYKQTRNLKKWIKALRSGKYKQTYFALVREKDVRDLGGEILPAGHCSLGVAAEVIGCPGKYPNMQTFGLTWRDQDNLMIMNDSERKTFAEIADYLEGEQSRRRVMALYDAARQSAPPRVALSRHVGKNAKGEDYGSY